MDKCRICLGNKKNLRCIFDVEDENSFAYKITCISNVKVNRDDGITDKICLSCRKKLREAFEFKLMIERSDAALQTSSNFKKLHFDNIKDIKIKIEVDNIPKYKCENDIDNYFKDGEDSIFYNGTTIKKLEPCDDNMKTENEQLTLLDFFNTFKGDSENDFDDCGIDVDYEPVSNDYDDEYLLPLSVRKNKSKKSNKKVKSTAPATTKERVNHNYQAQLKSVPKPIRPKFLEDLRVIPTRINKTKPSCKKKYRPKKKMCNYCGKFCVSSQALRKHLLIHTGERSHKCEKCGKGYLTAKDLSHHVQRHDTERNFKCEHCVAVFRTMIALNSHMICHKEEKNHVCDVCNKSFKRRSAMMRHKVTHNVTNKNVKCELCNMSFFTKYNLNHHMRIHTGERPYNCELCSQPYSYKHDFNRHCLKKHGVFLKRRSVNVMNEEVLIRERTLMRDLMLKAHGYGNDDENINPFEGPQSALAYEMTMKALKSKQIPIDFI